MKGFGYGLSEFVTIPYKGARDNGFEGFAKGVAMGTVGLVARPGAGMLPLTALCFEKHELMDSTIAMFGLFAYPAYGIYKSLSNAMSKTQKEILKARLEHDAYFSKTVSIDKEEVDHVIHAFGTAP